MMGEVNWGITVRCACGCAAVWDDEAFGWRCPHCDCPGGHPATTGPPKTAQKGAQP